MKNRVLLTMLIIFIVLSGVWITCGTVFVVRDVEIVDMTVQTAEVLTETEKSEIIKQSGLRGKNILFNLNQSEITKKVKSVNSMLKLQRMTAEFPSRVVLTISRRVPIFYDSENKKWFDSEMCVVEGTEPYRVNIAGANLKLVDDLDVGDLAVGKDERTESKIKQLKIIAGYFESLNGFEIAYNDDASEVGNQRYLCLLLKINAGVTFKIKVNPEDDFLHALEFTDQVYRNQSNPINGIYETMYRKDNPNKVGTQILDANGESIMKDKDGKDIVYYEE